MKKITAALTLCFFTLQAHDPKSSQTFLFTRPGQQNLCLKQAIWHNLLYDKETRSALDLAVYHQKSTHADKIQAYFLPAYRTQLLVNTTAINRDVLPFWLQLPADFNGVLKIGPQQTQTGFTIEGRHNLGNLFDIGSFGGANLFQDWCLFGSVSVDWVKNNWNLTQSNVTGAGPTTSPVYDILTAFNNPEWAYSKVNGPTHQNGLSEIRLGLRTTFLSSDRAQVATYSSISIPTKKKPVPTYIFEAQNGYGHVGIVWGIGFQFPFSTAEEKYKLAGTINFENIYLIRNHQYRTFDLNLKEWSRFLLLRKQGDASDTLIPGVNVLTHKVRISPHNIMDFSTGFRLTMKCIEGEVGFGVWGHKGERCRIYNGTWVPEYGIAGTLPNTTASNSTISYRAPNDATFVTIIQNDINLNSGAQTGCVAYKAYGSLGFKNYGEKCDNTFNIGGVVEFPHNPTDILSTWGIWTSAGIAF